MAMARVCTQATLNLTNIHSLQRLACHSRCRPALFSTLLSSYKQLSFPLRPTSYSPAIRFFPSPSISIFSQRFSMEKGVKSVSDHSSKELDPEEGDGGGHNDGGGNGRGDGGSGGGDDSSGHSKGDDIPRKSLFSWYLVLLNNHPIATKAITSALLTLIGDLTCQLMIEKSEVIDFKRIVVFTLLGLALVGPILHFWYLTLSKLVQGSGVAKAGARLVLDQLLFSPVFIGVFFTALLTLEGHSNDIVPKLRQDWPSAVVANWKIWIPFQFLNFLLVPQQLQVLAANVIALGWNTYLSFATHKDIMPPAQKDSFTS